MNPRELKVGDQLKATLVNGYVFKGAVIEITSISDGYVYFTIIKESEASVRNHRHTGYQESYHIDAQDFWDTWYEYIGETNLPDEFGGLFNE